MKDAHQSARPSFPFDHHAPEFVAQHRSIYHQMRRECPVAYAPDHGGFWVLSSYDLVADVARDDTRFSSAISLLIPPGDVDRLLPLQSDPPDLQRYRLALMPLFTPQAVERLRPALLADARDCVAGMAARGQAEVIEDLALPVPGAPQCACSGLILTCGTSLRARSRP